MFYVSNVEDNKKCIQYIKDEEGWKIEPKLLYSYENDEIIVDKDVLMDYYSHKYSIQHTTYTSQEDIDREASFNEFCKNQSNAPILDYFLFHSV